MNKGKETGRLSIADAYVKAGATAGLSERDKDIIKAFLARVTLIKASSEEAVGEEQHLRFLRWGSSGPRLFS